MTRKEIIQKKLERLSSVPDSFMSGINKVSKEYERKVIELVSQLQTNDGVILLNKKNIALFSQIDSLLKQQFLSTDFIKIGTDFIKQFDKQAVLSDDYFKKTFPDVVIPEVAQNILNIKKTTTIDLLLNDSVIDAQFVNPVKVVVETALTSQSTFKDLLTNLQNTITGNAEIDGKIAQYSKQVAYDSFAVSDAAYMTSVSDSINAEWYLYQGGEIADTRAFCEERHGHYYHKLEIEAWGSGKKTVGLETPDSTGHWQGEMRGTNAQTIFQTRGGYNCRHQLMPVSIFIVPKTDIQRAIEQGFYKPSEYEIEKFSL